MQVDTFGNQNLLKSDLESSLLTGPLYVTMLYVSLQFQLSSTKTVSIFLSNHSDTSKQACLEAATSSNFVSQFHSIIHTK